MALINYADAHNGKLPNGGATPEASLSLLYSESIDAALLRGKAYSEEAAAKLLVSGQPLTPETCGWHYVEGFSVQRSGSLRRSYRNIAVFWDKIGLGHNSERLPNGGHTVMFLGGRSAIVNEADWPRFVAEQEKAVAAIKRGETIQPSWVPDDEFPHLTIKFLNREEEPVDSACRAAI